MPNDELNQAIQLIEQGQDEQAQSILEALITANQQDLVAWSWYVKSCRTPEKRLDALKVCLHFNPDNPQILEAIRKLQEKLSTPPKPPLDFAAAPSNFTTAPEPSPYYAAVNAPEAVSRNETTRKPDKFTGLDEVTGHPYAWYEVWWQALTKPNVDYYTALLQDPLAGLGRAYWWGFMAALITGLISLANPSIIKTLDEIAGSRGGTNTSMWVAVILVVTIPIGAVLSVLALMLMTVLYNLLAKVFGGTGNFSRTFYLTTAFYTPFSIVSGILSIIPIINCLTIILSFYGFRLHVAAIQAAHRLNGARATLVVILPAIAFLLIFCILGVAVGKTVMDMPEFQRIIQNTR